MISVEMLGLAEAQAMIDQIPQKLDMQVRIIMQEVATSVLAIQNNLTPVRTGYLRSRNKVTFVSGLEIGFDASNDAPYAIFVNFGTRYMRARDFMTPAMVYGRSLLYSRLGNIAL